METIWDLTHKRNQMRLADRITFLTKINTQRVMDEMASENNPVNRIFPSKEVWKYLNSKI